VKSVKKRPPFNASAYHIFDALRLISIAEQPIGVGEISRRLDLPGPTVHRALTTLEEAGYISRVANTPRYELGLMPQYLARTLLKRFALTEQAVPVLRQLARQTGETTSLTVRLGWYGLRVAVVYGGKDIYHRDRLAELSLLSDGLASQCILSCLSKAEIERYRVFAKRNHPEAAASLQDDKKLRATLKLAGERNFLTQAIPMSASFASLALPLRLPDGACIAAVSINGPVFKLALANSLPAWAEAARAELEKIIGREPERFRSPYAHIDPDEMIIALPSTV
jgi:DNA-binding IclR family transcriptional regulator